ncbi:hypothetical protein [Bordetella trematum]|uniref:hypothetical protein n=1 Tax=Bordetella trematum TaxID=123899 RepID=UPI0013FD40E1|nr:hypothetical protein [Bordetella trematum]
MKKKQLRVNPGACLPLIGRRVSSCLAYPRPVWKKHLIAREQEEKDQRYQHLEIRAQKLPNMAYSFSPGQRRNYPRPLWTSTGKPC